MEVSFAWRKLRRTIRGSARATRNGFFFDHVKQRFVGFFKRVIVSKVDTQNWLQQSRDLAVAAVERNQAFIAGGNGDVSCHESFQFNPSGVHRCFVAKVGEADE